VDGDAQQERLRIGTREREEAMQILGDHFAEGRLALDEYEQRVGDAIEAQTFGDLRPLFHDLPPPHPRFMAPPPPPPAPIPAPIYPPVYLPPPPPPVYPPSMYYSDKSKMVAGVLQILLPFGSGRFYTGHTGIALAQLFSVFFFGFGILWSFVDGIVLLIKGGTDNNGRRLRDA
jgi:hypothetical protein